MSRKRFFSDRRRVIELLLTAAFAVGLVSPWRPSAGRRSTGDRHWGETRDARAESADKRLDPAAWGEDHVGEAPPEYVTGDECLFCHRKKIGSTWQSNRHNKTIRPAAAEPAAIAALCADPATRTLAEQVQFVLGDRRRLRFLRKGKGYGKLDLLAAAWTPGRLKNGAGRLSVDRPEWLTESFSKSCAGCHATAVDPQTGSFSAMAIDCYACHGDVDLAHTKDTSKVLLAKARKDPSRVVISTCGQCHIRGGASRSLKTPYANNFIAGDNLFRDLAVDFSERAIAGLNPIDAHILRNARDVSVRGDDRVDCLSCHRVHSPDGDRHQELPETSVCAACHEPGKPKSQRRRYVVHSRVCGY